MKEQFATYEISLSLKELGFDEDCFCYYAKPYPDERIEFNYAAISYGFVKQNHSILQKCSAPLWQQVIDWLESKNILISIYYDKVDKSYFKKDYPPPHNYIYSYRVGYYDEHKQCIMEKLMVNGFEWSYHKAREKAILKATELCQNKK